MSLNIFASYNNMNSSESITLSAYDSTSGSLRAFKLALVAIIIFVNLARFLYSSKSFLFKDANFKVEMKSFPMSRRSRLKSKSA